MKNIDSVELSACNLAMLHVMVLANTSRIGLKRELDHGHSPIREAAESRSEGSPNQI